jgi:hypothetical protein
MARARWIAPAGRGEAIAAAVVLIVAIIACLRLGRGYFLADDFVQLANFSHWHARGELWPQVLSRFAASIDGVNGFYRPLTFATYALNYVLGDAQAGRWLGVNLALHLANAVLVAWLVVRLAGPPTRASALAGIAAGVFFFGFAPVWEVAIWIACRYDALATFFTLLTGALLLAGHRGAALLATAAALLSKESGAGAILFAGLVVALQARRDGGAAWMRDVLRGLAPWVALGVAYAVLRWMVFGSATEVYRGAHPQLLSAQHWATLLSTGIVWAREVFPGMPGVKGLVGLSAIVIVLGLWLATMRDGTRGVAPLLATLAMLASSCALLLPHMLGFEPNGIGGRLFYQPAAFYAAALGLASREALAELWRRRVAASIACACAIALFVASLWWGFKGARDYLEAQWSMRDVAGAIAKVAARSPASAFDLVIVPDAVGRVPFARNAQAGLMLPPIQARDLSRKLLVQTDAEIAAIDRSIDGGVLAALRSVGLETFMELPPGSHAWPRLAPSRYLCWDAWRRRMIELPVGEPQPGKVGAALGAAYAASDCARRPARP